MSLEGELRIGLRLRDGHVERVRITSSRPDVAGSLLQGRTRAEVGAAVPLLFSICAGSQAATSELACAAAAGESPTAAAQQRCRAAVSAEMLREAAWRTLLDWPQWIGEKPGEDAVAAARGAVSVGSGWPAEQAAEAMAMAAFGVPAAEWLGLSSVAAFDRWADAGRTAAARFMRRLRDDEAAAGARSDRSAAQVALLDDAHHAERIDEIASAADADPDFARHPSWRGAPAETGALARLKSDALIVALTEKTASRVQARFAARLRELALLLTGRASGSVGAKTLPCGDGIAWVENARGLLIHRVSIAQGRALRYLIVAPTEWNFHPAGALPLALTGARAADLGRVQRHTTQLVHSLDPCVACRVEFDDA